MTAGAGAAMPRDRFGNVIQPGMAVIFHPPYDMVFDVVDVKPILDPRVQPGVVQITLRAEVPVMTNIHQPNMAMICFQRADPSQPAGIALTDIAAVPTDEAPADVPDAVEVGPIVES